MISGLARFRTSYVIDRRRIYDQLNNQPALTSYTLLGTPFSITTLEPHSIKALRVAEQIKADNLRLVID